MSGSVGIRRLSSTFAASVATVAWIALTIPGKCLGDRADAVRILDGGVAPFIEALLVKEDIPGLQIAVVADQALVWSRAFGFADVERGTRVTSETVFRAASVSKLFTATLFLQQVDAGRIGLDDDVNAHLDAEHRFRDAQGRKVRVTPRQLLTHTSGLPVTWFTWPQVRAEIFGTSHPTVGELLRHPTLTHPPGERIVYANPGYWMLGWLSERLAGADFADLMQMELLQPLGMTASSFRPGARLQARQAIPYIGSRDAYHAVPGPRALPVNPAASLLTTAEDLTRFARMILGRGSFEGKRILGADLVGQMQQLHARQDPALEAGYGLGFAVGDFRGHRIIAHEGYDPGVSSRLALFPDEGLAVAILVNATRTASIARVLGRVLRELSGIEDSDPERRAVDEWAQQWLGRYRAVDVMPPSLSWLERFSQLELELVGEELRFFGQVAFGFQTDVDGLLEPTMTRGIFRFRGAPWDGHRVLLRRGEDGERRIYVDILELRQVPFYSATPVVLGALSIVSFGFAAVLIGRFSRRFRRHRRAGN